MVSSFFHATIQEGLVSKACTLPIISSSSFCASPVPIAIPTATTAHGISTTKLPDIAQIQNVALDELLDYSVAGTHLVSNLQHAELAVNDLVSKVKASNITARDALVNTLVGFVNDARTAGRDLNDLTSKIHNIVGTMGHINSIVYRNVEAMGQNGLAFNVDAATTRALYAYMDHYAEKISEALLDGAALISRLDTLDARLSLIYELCVQERVSMEDVSDGFLWELWTALGGSTRQSRALQQKEATLKDVEKYRGLAVAYVSAVVHSLTAIHADLRRLRETAGSVGSTDLPMVVHLASMQSALQRLQDRQTKAGSRLALD
ncbi:hypothetical protein C8Q79DRAFT_916622 [Trametes meyenii]|nr:hypothetical protein C8Q79DRAFT_916622 [Trametes meyenii]